LEQKNGVKTKLNEMPSSDTFGFLVANKKVEKIKRKKGTKFEMGVSK
jgi:hypothetical protein